VRRDHTNVVVIAGGRGTGKTTLVQKVMEQSKLPKKLVLDTFHHPSYSDWPAMPMDFFERNAWRKGRFHFHGSDYDKMKAIVADHVKNTLVVFEDAAKMVHQRPSSSTRRICLDSKQTGNDVIFIYHSIGEIPQLLFKWMDYLVLFKTQERIENQKTRIHCYERILPAFNRVQDHQSKYHHETIQISG
jgi:hypothetical protein